ncbi:MAG: PHA/PHB synthase family protein [Pseudonocardia sp.]
MSSTHARAERTGAVAPPSLTALAGGVSALLGQLGPVANEALVLADELGKILAGSSTLTHAERDKRFADPAWTEHPAYRRIGQAYLAFVAALDRLVAQVEESGAPWRTVERARLARAVLGSTVAPTNSLLGNPAALKHAFDTAGASLVRGARNWLSDLRHNGGMPSQVDSSGFAVGWHTAVTPGAVVQRDEVAELIQYTPTTATVRRRPLLVVPPPIGRFYFLDLRPGRSFVEYALAQGHQVFMLSWRNPGPEQADWGIDTYAGRIVAALDAVADVTGSDDADVLAFCAGGILTTTVLNHLAATGRADRIASAALAVTLLDFDSRAPVGAFSSPGALALAADRSRREGVISAKSLGAVFSWMRPDDLVYGYVVNNYLMGRKPPAFDILACNADGTNLPARLHGEFLDVFGDNLLAKPDALTVLGSPVDLGRIRTPMFVAGARTDHLTPWVGCYRTTQLVSGPCTFALSNAGHVASLVNPPGNPKSHYAIGPAGGSAEVWEAGATTHTGSWWEGWAGWVEEHSPAEQVDAPAAPGNAAHPPLTEAPGLYVRDLTA